MWRSFWALVALGLVMGSAFAILAPPGAPYDEPSHFSVVQFYGDRLELPVMGAKGVSYEAQQPPLYYAAGGLIYRAGRGLGGVRVGFYAVRLATLLLAVPIALGVRKLAQHLFPSDEIIPAMAGGFAAIAAPILTTSASVQNDSLAISLSLAGTIVFLKAQRKMSIYSFAIAGAAFGVGLLAKTSILPVAGACGLALIVQRRPGWVRHTAVFAASLAAVSGWWFVRNIALYGDLTGHSAITRTGYPSLTGEELTPHNLAFIAYSTAASYWAPAEYYRNVFRVPFPLRILIGLVLLTVVAGLATQLRGRRFKLNLPAVKLVSTTVAATFLLWLVVRFTTDPLPARLTYVVFGPFAIAVAAGATAWRHRARLAPAAVAVLVNAWFLAKLAHEPPRIFHLW